MDNYQSKRTIEEALDLETGEIILSTDFFNQDENLLINYRRHQQEAISGIRKPKYVCPYCFQILKISGKSTQRGKVSFFAHLYDSDECEIKTNGEYSQEEIEARKYLGVVESQRHFDLKDKIYTALTNSESEKLGISNVKMEKRFQSDNPLLNWKKPDVYAEYNGQKLVFELQLSTTFLSVIVSRDIFYRLNNTFIIWIFNFSENTEYINLDNLMCKDIYYANKRNAFVLNEEAIQRSEQEKELVLLCIWFEPIIENAVIVKDKIIRHEKYVKISDLKFDNEDFKPYYIDSDKLFLDHQPDQIKLRIQQEKEGAEWFNRLEEKILTKFEEKRIEEEKKEKEREEKITKIILGISNGIHDLSPVNKKGKWGYESEGEIIIQPVYDLVEPFSLDGFAKVRKNRRYGFLNTTGDELIPPFYHELFEIYKNCCIARIKKEWFCINIDSNLVSKLEFDVSLLQMNLNLIKITRKEKVKNYARNISGGWYRYYIEYSYCGIMDFSGQILIPAKYTEISPFVNGEANAKIDGVEGVLKMQNNEIQAFVYGVEELNHEGKAKARKNGLWGYIDLSGNELLPFIYDVIEGFQENNRAKVCKNGFWGCLDSELNEVIPCVFSSIERFQDDRAKVEKEGFWGYIDSNGNEIISCVFDAIELFQNSRAKVRKKGLWGYIDPYGAEIIPCVFSIIEPFRNNIAKVQKNNKWGYIDIQGKILVNIIYDELQDFYNGYTTIKKKDRTEKIDGLARYKISDKRGYVDKNGNEYWQYWKDERDFHSNKRY